MEAGPRCCVSAEKRLTERRVKDGVSAGLLFVFKYRPLLHFMNRQYLILKGLITCELFSTKMSQW